jgi:membrane-associated phospholipid phosphatase
MMGKLLVRTAGAAVIALLAALPAAASGLDHRISYDDSGIWARSTQKIFFATLLASEAGGALWEGGETRLGRTLWQSIDATAFSGVSAYALKYAFSRVRPSDSADPNLWFKGHGNESFPSGEVTVTSAIVTPLVLEYGKDHPWVYGLELLPVYDGIARMKTWSHWQTDVIAGFALGTGVGYLVHSNPNKPYILRLMPHGIYVGLKL